MFVELFINKTIDNLESRIKHMLSIFNDKTNLKYVSLFSSSGVGDYGFYLAGFNLIATNELLPRRMHIQLVNHIAKKDSAYITGSILDKSIQKKLYKEINCWAPNDGDVDLLVATPPCQGISIANHFKKKSDLKRNSLVLQSILVSNRIHPKTIVFENVKRFMKTACTDSDGSVKTIKDVIYRHLSSEYNIFYKEINFDNYGANSSRPRTLVICTLKKFYGNSFNPAKLMPTKTKPKVLKDVIGDLPRLTRMGQINSHDILHEFKPYRKMMRKWIHNLKPGQSAFQNKNNLLKPHHYVNGHFKLNVNKNKDKYRRQEWNKVAPAVHTRNDILASQNTVHPRDDRVFSIRELLRMMNVPSSFKWSKYPLSKLNKLPYRSKRKWLKKNEMIIRQSLGEAVPPVIFNQIGNKIRKSIKVINDSKSNQRYNEQVQIR